MNQTQTRSLRKKVLSLILAVVMVVSLLPISAFASGNSKASTTDSTDYYKILHLDCGRKYFSKDWIIALLNEMKADGYNQLQLAFGNDGLRFLLDDMSFTANGTTYSHKTVVSKVEAGNKLQNSSGDASWLTQTEMDEIIAAADKLHIEIVPLLNLPGHANAILDIVNNNMYNAKIYGTVSQNTLDVTNDAACNFGYEIFKKYVDYFSSKGCKYFNFGADEYGNDIGDGNPHFNVLKGTGYENLSTFINKLAAYIGSKNMTPRTFNDALYYNKGSWDMQTTTNTAIKTIQCCYWSSGWDSYPVAEASTIVSNGHAMINTNGAYYYVLGKDDAFTPGKTKVHDAGQYTAAAKFDNTAFASGTVNNPVGSMFCIWSDFPNAETETQVAQNVRLVMRAMALRMDGESIDRMDTSVVANGFNADGTLNRAATGGDNTYTSEVDINLTVGQPSDVYTQAGDVTDKVNKDGFNETVASIVGLEYKQAAGTKKNVLGDKVSMDEDGTYTGVISDGTHYMIVNSSGIDSTTAIDKATKFTVTRTTTTEWFSTTTTYTIQGDDGQFLKVTQSGSWNNRQYKLSTDTTAVDWSYSSRDGFSSDSTYYRYYITYNNGWNVSSGSGTGFLYGVTTEGTDPVNETQITFKGNAVGETSVIIGSVKYNITVTAEDLSKVTPLKLEYWITNASISTVSDTYDTRTNTKSQTYKAYYTAIAADYNTAVATADGVDVTTFAPAKTGHESRDVYYWRCRMLDTALTNTSTNQTEQQTNDAGDDETVSGIGFTKIRYYESKWQVFTDNNAWVDVTSTKQLVAYYREYIKVTDEVESFAADWGKLGDGSVSGTYLDPSSVNTISYQVVYEDGKTNPSDTTAAALASKTLCYGHWDDGRGIGTIMLSDTADYEIYKVTAETGTMTGKSNSSGYYGNYTVSSFSWKKDEATVWDEESDQKESNGDVVIHNNANTPNKEGNYRNLTWLENNESILIRVYVRAKTVDGALTVHYVDETTSAEFYNYNIIVSNTASNKTTFKENISLANPWKGDLANGDVVNKFGATQIVTADLGKMPAIPAKYRYAVDYTCVRVVRSADGTEVTLYYTFKTDKTFVVDFGLPLVIQPTDISAELGNAELDSVTATSNLQYADITSDTDYNITYKLTTMLNGADKLDVKYDGRIPVDDGTQTGSVSYVVGIIPASTVYYEDNFVEFSAGSAGWTRAGTTETNAVQQLDELGKTGANNYGYDNQYNSSSKFSLGSAMKTTVSSATNSNPPTATFTFKGTGFDLVSMTSKDTGTILVNVVGKDGAGNDVKENWIVDTFYGYTRRQDGYIQYTWTLDKDGKTWHNTAKKIPALPEGAETGGKPVKSGNVTYEPNYIWMAVADQSNALYQIPVIHYTDLPYGTYTVTITPKYSSARDPYNKDGGANDYDFYLDGVRIYNPAGDKLNDQYVQDGEGYAQFTEIRDMLIAAKDLKLDTSASGVVFVDGVGNTSSIADYTNYGPNNEVYLSKGQAIAFKISDMSNVDTIQIGAKAPSGNTTMQIKVNGNDVQTQELATASDMYYKLDSVTANKTVVITNTSDHLLSLTTLKVTYKTAPTAMNSAEAIVDSDVLAQAPVMLTSMLYGEPQTFEPSRFEANWGRSVRAGQKATLTVKASDDVGAIEVNGVTIDTYRTRTERTGWGWWAKRVTYREFTYTMTAEATADYAVYALNSDGIKSEPTTATLTVKPAINWWHKWF